MTETKTADTFADRIVQDRMTEHDARRIVREVEAGRWETAPDLLADARKLISGDAR